MKHVERPSIYILQILLSSVKELPDYKSGFLELQFECYGGTQNSIPAKVVEQRVLQGREKQCSFTQIVYQEFGLEGKIVLYIQLGQGMYLTCYQEGMSPLVEKNSSSQQQFSLWQLSNFSAALIQNVQQWSGTSSDPGGPQVTAPSHLMQFFSRLLLSCILRSSSLLSFEDLLVND